MGKQNGPDCLAENSAENVSNTLQNHNSLHTGHIDVKQNANERENTLVSRKIIHPWYIGPLSLPNLQQTGSNCAHSDKMKHGLSEKHSNSRKLDNDAHNEGVSKCECGVEGALNELEVDGLIEDITDTESDSKTYDTITNNDIVVGVLLSTLQCVRQNSLGNKLKPSDASPGLLNSQGVWLHQ